MVRHKNHKTRRMCMLTSFFVLLISLSSCSSAGSPSGKLNRDEVYATAGNKTVTKGELWDNLKWSANDVLSEKINEVVMKDYFEKVELVVEKNFTDLTNEQKNIISKNLTAEDFDKIKEIYLERLEDYVIEDIYNFSYSSKNSFEKIDSVNEYDAKKLILKYVDEMYTNYNISSIDNKRLTDLCTEAVNNRDNYIIIAKEFSDLYYFSLAKELLAYDNLEEDIQDAYENRDTENENDIGYFTKSEFTSTFKNQFANQCDLNMVLIGFATEEEYYSTLRAFGIKVYEGDYVYLPKTSKDMTFSEYCEYYDDITTTELDSARRTLSPVMIAEIFIQMYNYLYGGYRDYIYDESYISNFNNVDTLINIADDIRIKYQSQEYEQEVEIINQIGQELKNNASQYDVDTIYTRDEIDDIDASMNTYLYETLVLPNRSYEQDADTNDKCYSTDVQSYNDVYWLAYKFSQTEDKYDSIYNKDTVDDDLYDSIVSDKELENDILEYLKREKMSETLITEALTERTDEVEIKIFDEALEIAYAKSNTDYSKTYGSAPNSNVIATLKYNNKTWNLNIVEDLEDSNALNSGVYDILEKKIGITTAIDILSKKVVKDTKSYADTAKNRKDYEETIEYVLAAFSNNYYSSSGYPSTIGKYNFMMLYFHTANIEEIINETYRINDAAAKLLTNYNSDELLTFYKSYADNIYNNYFSITGKRLLVYLDANDDAEKDDITEWTDKQKQLAQQLIYSIYTEVASTSGSHATALSDLVTEINESARAKFENNPIAPENKWAEYRKAGLKIELVDVTATNSSTDIDFALKARMLDIYNSEDYSINQTTPTEYLEDLQNANTNPEMILQTPDGYNLLLITSADFQTSAEFTAEDDELGIYKDLSVYYNDEYCSIGSIYNDDKLLTLEQIRLYVLEYVSSSTSNLSPSALSEAYTNFLSPIITRYTGAETQREIVIYLIENMAGKIDFNSDEQNERYKNIIEINHNAADDYISVYYEKDTTGTLKTYENWWNDLQEIIDKILLTEGEE